ncbi:MAG: SDR family NAD(P)-dependent oxidoreductase [Spirosomataceae bacterium]
MTKKRIVLITGATSGIGEATARLLAQTGNYRLILTGRNVDKLNELETEFGQKTEVKTLLFDVRSAEEVQVSLDTLEENWKNVDVLVNNAGNAHGLSAFQEGSLADWDAMIDGNVQGLLYVSRLVVPQMVERKTGHIINLSSVAGKQTYANGAVYCASKKAVEAISEGMRLDLTVHGIKVTNIAPGAVETAFSKVRFKGDEERAATVYAGYQALQAEDIADVIKYVLEVPDHVTIADLTIYPKAQSAPTTIHRSN